MDFNGMKISSNDGTVNTPIPNYFDPATILSVKTHANTNMNTAIINTTAYPSSHIIESKYTRLLSLLDTKDKMIRNYKEWLIS